MDHLRPSVRLLIVVSKGDRVELANRVITSQDHGGVLPSDGRASLNLRPRNLRIFRRHAALSHEVVNTALAFFRSGVPVLDRRVLDLTAIQRDQLNDRCMQLARAPYWRRATFQVTDIGSLIGNDQCSFELTRPLRVDAEIRHQLNWATHSRRNIGERAIRENRRVQRSEEVVGVRNHRPQILLHQVRVILYRLRERAEHYPALFKLLGVRRGDRNRVEHRIDCYTSEALAFVQRNP